MRSLRVTGAFAALLMCVCVSFLIWLHAARTHQASASPQSSSQQTPTIEEYNPKSTLVTPEHKIERAKFPFIDIHSHHWNPTAEHVEQLVKEMDTINLRVLVNLSGGTGEALRKTEATMKGRHQDRFVVFSDMSFVGINTTGYGVLAAER